MECVYVLSMEGASQYKIGRTGKPTPHLRFLELRRGNPLLQVVTFYPCQRSVYLEWFVHTLLAKYRRDGEWFECSLQAIEKAMTIALANEHNPVYFMTLEQRWRYDEWREDRREENSEEWLMLEHMGLDIEEFVPIEPSIFTYPWPEDLPPYWRPLRKQQRKKK